MIISVNSRLFILLTSRCFSRIIKRKLPDIILASSPQLPAAYVSLIIANSLKFGVKAGLLNVLGTQIGVLILIFLQIHYIYTNFQTINITK